MEETRAEEEDLEGLPLLNAYLEGFLAKAVGEMTPSRLCHLSHLTTTAPSGSSGMESSLIPQHGGKSSEVPSLMDVQEFVRQVQALFQLPKVNRCTQGVDNDYLALPAPQSLDHDQFLPAANMRFDRQDYNMRQCQKTLAYTKALQYWAEKAQLPPPGEPCQMVENMIELWQAMKPLTTFTNAEVLEDTIPSHWIKITSSQISEPVDPLTSWE